MAKNSQAYQLHVDLNKTMQMTYKSLAAKYKKMGLKKQVSELKNNTPVLAFYLALRNRIVELLSELTLEQHYSIFHQVVQLLSHSKQLQSEFFDFQTQLNHAEPHLINSIFVEFRNKLATTIDSIEVDHDGLNQHRISSNVFNVLISFLFKQFDQSQPKLDELYLDFINEIDATVLVLSSVSLRVDKSAKSEALATVNKMSLIKMKKDKKDDPSWLKVVAMLKDQEVIGYLPKAYIKLS